MGETCHIRRLAARRRAGVEHGLSGLGIQQGDGQRRPRILYDELPFRISRDIRHLGPSLERHERTVLARQERLRRRIVPGRETLRVLRSEPRGPPLAQRRRKGLELRTQSNRVTLTDEIAQNTVRHPGNRRILTGLRCIHRLVDRREIRHIIHVENLGRANVKKRLEFALRPRLHETAEDATKGTQPTDHRVNEILDKRAVGSVRQQVGREVLREHPTGDDIGGGATGVIHKVLGDELKKSATRERRSDSSVTVWTDVGIDLRNEAP